PNTSTFYWLHQYWDEPSDPRTRNYFLVHPSMISMALLMIVYMLLVVVIIPGFMRNRKPFNLKGLIIGYDVLMVLINGYFFAKTLQISCFGLEMWNFKNTKGDTSPKAMEFIDTAYYYYLSKLVDMVDTFFMAFRKKNSHISFLHVWHHISLPSAGWMFMKYNPYMPTICIIPIINTFIHVIMYSYYALAALGPQYQKYLWWKRYITQIQLIQFLCVMSWFVVVYYKQTDLPIGYMACNFGNAVFLYVLFAGFYRSSYKQKVAQTATKTHKTLKTQ
ncbi:unnamed protein product, partial [Oppiella nova]